MVEKLKRSMRAQVVMIFVVSVLVTLIGGVCFMISVRSLAISFDLTAESRQQTTDIQSIVHKHYQWRDALRSSIANQTEFKGNLNPDACDLGLWLSSDELSVLSDEKAKEYVLAVETPHREMHQLAEKIVKDTSGDHIAADAMFEEEIIPRMVVITQNMLAAVGCLEEDAAVHQQQLKQDIFEIIIIVALMIGVFVLVLFAIVRMLLSKIVKPIIHLTDVSARLAKGDLSARAAVKNDAEIRRLADALNGAATNLQAYTSEIGITMQELANNNLSVEITQEYVGDFALIKTSVNKFVERMNETITTVSGASKQVYSASGNISASATEIAQGAVEQTVAVADLSGTINTIAHDIKISSEHTNSIKVLTDTVSHDLINSNEQMEQLTSAMQDINSSSDEITKIIKTIEDIAFQTNILALNAAVEAARAGAAGKGFAVVADEVRNLANKSSEAAKRTNALVETSVSSIKNGVTLAGYTAQSLGGVVAGAEQISDLVAKIAGTAEQQSSSMDQIDVGVEQISNVMQTNSATSEECAAASEELNAQAFVLQQLVGEFKLKGH